MNHNTARLFLLFASSQFVQTLIAAPPYPGSDVITGFSLDWSTHQRFAQGSDNFQLTWADDDNLYGAWGDGGGFGGTNSRGRVSIGVARIEGSPPNIRGINVWGGHGGRNPAKFRGKSWGMISVDKSLYMWIVPGKPDGKNYRSPYEYIELAQSTDRAATWTKGDWKFLQSENLTIPTFLNFGKDNEGVPARFGDFVYSYFIRPKNRTIQQYGPQGVGLIVHKPGALYLARVRPRDLLANKSNYEFYRGLDTTGHPLWGTVAEKSPVFEDPNGVGWCMSASYNPFFNRVLLCTEHGNSQQGTIGIFDAPAPWGPWTTVKYFDRSSPFGVAREGSKLPWKNNVFFVAFATKWIQQETFVLNFTGSGSGSDNDSFNTVRGKFRSGKH